MIKKNPIGLMPRYIHVEFRLEDIRRAKKEYEDLRKPVPTEWIQEEKDLTKWLEEFTRKNTRKV